MDSIQQTLDHLQHLIDQRHYSAAIELADSLHPLIATDELPWLREWAVCEMLADREQSRNPQRAIRLYELAQIGYRALGAEATGSGEGLVAMYQVERLANKIARLRQR